MTKKIIYIILILFLVFIPITLAGCKIKIGSYTVNNFTITKKKPNNFYYTNSLAKNLTLESSIKIKLMDTNFYKEKDLSIEDIDTVRNFTKALKKNNFIEKPKDLPEKPLYKLFFTFNKEKYVINVYSEKYISVYPWDGNYSMDYIDMEGIQPLYNLCGLCKYLIPR
ncbi:DUF4883 family protein [Clostridium swellfunianum]|uniref:DUF4883 family protein n=1 Tax=Clostridium swellfunianum TaxID=1367462 RepID=UPI0020306074|nr:DUF4883 family protein [Clostridium swellfunianum]MCM0648485.1 DUF4883 family protein [Clostridium swellfunianum]